MRCRKLKSKDPSLLGSRPSNNREVKCSFISAEVVNSCNHCFQTGVSCQRQTESVKAYKRPDFHNTNTHTDDSAAVHDRQETGQASLGHSPSQLDAYTANNSNASRQSQYSISPSDDPRTWNPGPQPLVHDWMLGNPVLWSQGQQPSVHAWMLGNPALGNQGSSCHEDWIGQNLRV
jgi:hypothetical protein